MDQQFGGRGVYVREQISVLTLPNRDLVKMLSQDNVINLAFTEKLLTKWGNT